MSTSTQHPHGDDVYWRLATWALVGGLICAFGADMLRLSASLQIPADAPHDFAPPVTRSWAILTYLGIACVVSSGLIAVFRGEARQIGRGTMAVFWAMQIWVTVQAALYLAGTNAGLDDWVHGKGPAVWWTCAAIFACVNEARWRVVRRMIYAAAFIAAALALWQAPAVQFTSTYEPLRKILIQMDILLWTSPLLLLTITNERWLTAAAKMVPFVVLCLCALLVAGRSWILIVLIYAVIFAFSGGRQRRIVFLKLAPAGCALAIGLWMAYRTQASTALGVLMEHLPEDTRSGQLIEFFNQVSAADLFIGKGPLGTWTWGGEPYGYIDCSYLLMLFTAGAPLLTGYFCLLVVPAWRTLRSDPPRHEWAMAIMLMLWALALTGVSTYARPTVSLSHFLLCLYAGRCFGWLDEARRIGRRS